MSKEITIKGFDMFQSFQAASDMPRKDMRLIGDDQMQVSDGYHTMDELYDHRIALWIAYCLLMKRNFVRGNCEVFPWRSRKHSDGELAFNGKWFVLGIGMEKGEQITYHLPIEKWDDCEFAETLEKAPEWDGHSPADVLERLGKL